MQLALLINECPAGRPADLQNEEILLLRSSGERGRDYGRLSNLHSSSCSPQGKVTPSLSLSLCAHCHLGIPQEGGAMPPLIAGSCLAAKPTF